MGFFMHVCFCRNFFQIPTVKIHEWLNERAKLASKIGYEKMNDIQNKMKALEKGSKLSN